MVTWLSCFPWATSRAPAHRSQGSSWGRILGNTFAGDKDGHSCVSGDLHRGDKIQNCWMEKNPNQINTKKSPNKTNSAQEEINPQIKGMCWQSGICWLLSDLVLWINDFFSVLLHLFQPLPSFILASLLCCSDWQKGNKLYPAGVFRRKYLFPRTWMLDLVSNSYSSQQFKTLK